MYIYYTNDIDGDEDFYMENFSLVDSLPSKCSKYTKILKNVSGYTSNIDNIKGTLYYDDNDDDIYFVSETFIPVNDRDELAFNAMGRIMS